MAHRKDLAAICCLFNPAHSLQRMRNFHRFRRLLQASDVSLYTVELAFDDDLFELPAHSGLIRIRGGDVMWQKERLLQLGAERAMEEGHRKLVFLDADLMFRDKDWAIRVSSGLDTFPVLQCFSTATRNFTDGAKVQRSAAWTVLEGGEKPGGAKGIAWAVSAEVFEKTGLYQHCVVGGGDTAYCFAALGIAFRGKTAMGRVEEQDFLKQTGPEMRAHYDTWAENMWRVTGGRCGYVDQPVFTMSHGSRKGRKYKSRHELLRGFDPEKEVVIGDGGAFLWTATGSRRRSAIERYFHARDEDYS